MNIQIPSFRTVKSKRGKYVVYLVQISFYEWVNVIEKRFSEFNELHETMKLIKKVIKKPIPKFLSKMRLKSFFKSLSETDLENRRSGLETYIQSLEITECAKHSKFFPDFCGLSLRYRDLWALSRP